MKKILFVSLLLFIGVMSVKAQKYFPNEKEFDGDYYSSVPFRIGGALFPKVFAGVGDYKGKKILAVMACSNCGSPTIMFFDEESSIKIKRAVFYAKGTSTMAIEYDKESFVIVEPTESELLVIFFSKNKATKDSMTKEKALAYAVKYAEQL